MRLTRRNALKLLGGAGAAGLVGAGLSGCIRKPNRKIVSFAEMPEYMKPGEALSYASTWMEGPYPYGILIKTVDGRPIKVDGNPRHPINAGASTAAMQAACMALYDPLRMPAGGGPPDWNRIDARVVEALRRDKPVVLVTRATLGPSERALIRKFQMIRPHVRHIVWEPLADRARRSAWRRCYGADGEWLPRYDKARVIVTLGCDFLGTEPAALEAIRQFAWARAPHPADSTDRSDWSAMPRLYAFEGDVTLTGANADHRIALRPSQTPALVSALRNAVTGSAAAAGDAARLVPGCEAILEALIKDLKSHHGAALVVAGPEHPEPLHAAVALLNDALGAPGRTLEWNPSPAALPADDPADLAAALREDASTVFFMGVEPSQGFPDVDLGKIAQAAATSEKTLFVSHDLIPGCGGIEAALKLPGAHTLESWNDAEPRAGLWSLCQPTLAPLFGARQEADSLLAWMKSLAPEDPELRPCAAFHDFVRERWRRDVYPHCDAADSFDRFWEGALRAGVVDRRRTAPPPALQRAEAERLAAQDIPAARGLELVIRPHHAMHDGRFGQVAWLRELPHPLTQMVWDALPCAAAPTLATLPKNAAALFVPQPGMAKGVVSLACDAVHRHPRGALFQPLPETTAPAWRFAIPTDRYLHILNAPHDADAGAGGIAFEDFARWLGAEEDARRRTGPVLLQSESSAQDRPIALGATLREYSAQPDFVRHRRHIPDAAAAQMHAAFDYEPRNRWGMAIDLSRCVGCGACVVACQAENNIPAVGRAECARGRRMHWLRIDRYVEGDPENPRFQFIPILCQHCENAPCETVCPVVATTHSPEGLNEMTYNRCVGTRYCANNCPFKVRRFNFRDYPQRFIGEPRTILDHLRFTERAKVTDYKGPQRLALNPQVSVRTSGVMEKCTFCVQRITAARYRARRDGLKVIPDAALQTACQQACPAGAIVFGDLNDPNSHVAQLAASPRSYRLLEELNLKNRAVYLARITNPAFEPETSPGQAHDNS